MKEMVKKHVKTLLLLVLCVALAATSVNFNAAVSAKAASSESDGASGAATNPSDLQHPGEKSGSGEAEKEPGSDETGDEPGVDDPGKDDPDADDPGKGDPGVDDPDKDDPDKDDPEEKPEKVTVTASVKLAKNKKAARVTWKRVKGAKTYKVQRSSKKNSGFKNIASLSESDRFYRDEKVTKGTRYYYRVAAKLEDGRTCYSKAVVFNCPLSQVSGVKLIRYSTTSIKVTWNSSKDKNAKWYKVYYAKSKDGKYKLAGTTDKNWYRVKNLKNNQAYYFQVKACVSKNSPAKDSELSKAVSMTTKPYERLTIFAGDSITTGLTSYGTVNKINIGGRKKVVAAIGLNTITFRTKRVFNGLSATQSIIANKPYRVYIMLGNNDIHYRNKKDVVDGYREILNVIRSGSPETDIVVLAVAPVTAATKNRRTGFKQIPAYNKDLKALAESMGLKYYDCTAFMKDSTGWLKSSYAAGDGIHWKSSVYDQYAKLLEAYDKSLD